MYASDPLDTVTARPSAWKSDALTQHSYLATPGHFGTSANGWFLGGIFALIILVIIWYVRPLLIDAISRRIARRTALAAREAAGYVIIPTMVDSDRVTLPGVAATNLPAVPTVAPVIDVIPTAARNSGGRWGRFDLAAAEIHPAETYGDHADTNDFRTAQLPTACTT